MTTGSERPEDLLRFAEKVVAVLDRGSFVSTYKHAVLLALMDLCLEKTGPGGLPTTLSTEEIARKVTELYWPQSWPVSFAGEATRTLRQSSGRQARILRLIHEYQEAHGVKTGTSFHQQRSKDEKGVVRLLREIEWTLVKMPLPKLQRIGGQIDTFLFEIAWDDDVRPAEFRDGSSFVNLVRFKPNAARFLVALAPVLRPLIYRQWALLVTRLNGLPESKIEDFLFGRDRAAVARLAKPLLEIQRGRCFYCDGPVADREVDHFVPWSRHPDDGIANLVVADSRCNRNKRDFIADLRHLERWSERLHEYAPDLSTIAGDHGWPRDEAVTTAVVRSIYGALPSDVPLWAAVDQFAPLDVLRLRTVLDRLPTWR